MLIIVTMSAVSVAACLVTLSRVIGWKRILRHATLVDVSFTLGTFIIFAGTLTGALVAVLGGLLMALVLSVAKRIQSALNAPSRPAAKSPFDVPTGADPSEYNKHGWIYNQAPYI